MYLRIMAISHPLNSNQQMSEDDDGDADAEPDDVTTGDENAVSVNANVLWVGRAGRWDELWVA